MEESSASTSQVNGRTLIRSRSSAWWQTTKHAYRYCACTRLAAPAPDNRRFTGQPKHARD